MTNKLFSLNLNTKNKKRLTVMALETSVNVCTNTF